MVTVNLTKAPPGEVHAAIDDFARGFRNTIDVAVDSRGRLYVADYSGGQVYQVSWVGDQGQP